jgi:lipopolysaccharide export system permease protein
MALPLSILMSSLMTFGNLGEHYELTAIKASGISLQRIMRPLVVVIFLVSIGDFFFANDILPYANLQMRSLLYDIRQQRPELQIKPGEFNNLIDGYSIRVNDKDKNTNVLYGVTIYDHSEGKGNSSVILADSGTMVVTANDKHLIITLYNGYTYNELFDTKKPRKKRTYPHRYDTFEEQQILIELTGFGLKRTDQSLFKSHYSMLNLQQLEVMMDSIQGEITAKENNILRSLVSTNLFKKRELTKKTAKKDFGKERHKYSSADNIDNSKNIRELKTIQHKPAAPAELPNKDTISQAALDTIAPKETLPEKPIQIINVDSLYASMTVGELQRVSGSALSFARQSKNLVVNSVQSLNFKVEHLRRYEIEWHRKFTLSVACLLFLFIGAPLGAIIRKGGLGLPMVVSVVFFILYYILSLTGEKLVRSSIASAPVGMWATSLLYAIIGAFITYKATTDSSLFNMDTYTNFIKKVFGQKYNVVDMVNIKKRDADVTSEAKTSNIYSSLFTLNEDIDRLLESKNFSSRPWLFIANLFSVRNDSNLILFERLYYNTFGAIINHQVFNNKNVRAKAYEFPAFNVKEFEDSNLVQVVMAVLVCIPPFTIFVLIRQYVKLTVFRSKLKQIKKLIPEMGTLLKISDAPNKNNENTSSLQ